MNDRVIAGLVTFGALMPMCALCLFGPAAIGAAITWLGVWLGGFDVWLALLAAAGAALAIYGLARQRARGRRQP